LNISQLISLLLPPSIPSEVHETPNWDEVEARLNIALPTDYKEFIGAFGIGEIAGEIWMLNPFSERFNLYHYKDLILGELGKVKAEFPEEYSFPLFPEEKGLLPCAVTNNGDVIFWKTRGNPDDWTILLLEVRSTEYETYDMPLTDFLAQLLKSEIKSEIISSPPFNTYVKFKPLLDK
jgi:hypothetical protein